MKHHPRYLRKIIPVPTLKSRVYQVVESSGYFDGCGHNGQILRTRVNNFIYQNPDMGNCSDETILHKWENYLHSLECPEDPGYGFQA